MKTLWIPLFTIITLMLTVHVSAQELYFATTSDDDSLRVIDVSSGTIIDAKAITVVGEMVVKSNGLARNPSNDELFCLLQLQGQPNRFLAQLDTVTGAATLIGDTGDKFAGIVFNNAGVLYGVTGDGGNVPEALYTINISNASTTLASTLGNGDDGETIAYDPNNNLFYHASGIGTGRVYERLNVAFAVTNIPITGVDYEEATALTYRGNGSFLLASWERIYDIDLAGNVIPVDTLNFFHGWKGLVRTYGYLDLEEMSATKTTPKLVKIVDIFGREVKDEPNKLLIYVYSDGTMKKIFRIQ